MGEELFSKGLSQDDVHEYRKQIDALIVCAQRVLDSKPEKAGREMAIVKTKLQEAKMWAGKVLEEMGSELPKEFQDKA